MTAVKERKTKKQPEQQRAPGNGGQVPVQTPDTAKPVVKGEDKEVRRVHIGPYGPVDMEM